MRENNPYDPQGHILMHQIVARGRFSTISEKIPNTLRIFKYLYKFNVSTDKENLF